MDKANGDKRFSHKTTARRSEMLPSKFTGEERDAYDWLCECQINPWMVCHINKKVTAPEGVFKSTVEYAVSRGMLPHQ
jgi:hypothetical protein